MKEKELLCACPSSSCWSRERNCFELKGGREKGLLKVFDVSVSCSN